MKYYLYIDECGDNNLRKLHTVVEQRGKKEDEKLCMFYNQLLGQGTYWASAERLRGYAKTFKLLPKKANVVGLQVADLVAYPITRHILDPNEPNMAYEVIKDNIYTENLKQVGIKIIPSI